MYRVALSASESHGKLKANAMCNYAVFLCRCQKKRDAAEALFMEGLQK
jgi:Tfp pilus assembly protein PilF